MRMPVRSVRRYGRRKRITGKTLKEAAKYALTTVVAVLAGVIVISLFGIRTRNVGESMEPMLFNGQNVLIDRLRYIAFSPGRGSVIVFLPHGNAASHYYIKRVVALPGDRVQVIGNELYVNGARSFSSEEGYDLMEDAGIAEAELKLAQDEYFVLGDNRNSSEDSRSANIGPVKKEQIVGAAWFKYGGTEGETGFVN